MKEKQQGKHRLEATGWKINHVTLRETSRLSELVGFVKV